MKEIPAPTEDRILPFLRSCDLLQMLDPQQLELLVADLEWYLAKAGEVLIQEGATGEDVYLIYEGQLEVFTCGKGESELILSEPGPGEAIGELAMVSGGERRASVRARGPATVARLSRDQLVRLHATDPTVLECLTETIRRRLRKARLVQLLSTCDLFSGLSEPIRRDLMRELDWVILTAGEDFVRQGERGDCLGVVVSGHLSVYLEEAGKPLKLLGRLGKGSVVGEMALLTGEPRTATVRATRDTELVRLSQSSFHRLVEKYPLELMRVFVGGVIQHLWKHVDTRSLKTKNIATIAIVTSQSDLPSESFSSRLERALAPMGSIRRLNSSRVDRDMQVKSISQTPREGKENGRLIAWLNAQEFRSNYVLYEADASLTAWTRRCIRQADLVLIVARGGGQPLSRVFAEREWVEALNSTQSPNVLVLIHEDDSPQPVRTEEWLKERPEIETHFHVRENRVGDYERLARLLTGHALGVVLSGGGVRGSGHIGVLRAVEEAGLSIDYIGGNSAGSFVAAAYATGHSLSEMPDLIRRAYKPANFFDPTLPVYSLFAGRRGANYFRKVLGDISIEDLWLPFFCVSSNLTRAELMIHDRGSVWRSVLASNSPPGLRPPVIQNGDLLTDGALLDNLPLDVMREKIGSGKVLAVDVSPPLDLTENPDYGESLSGWRILWSHLNPLTPSIDLPSINAIIHRANQLGSIRAQRNLVNAELADLYLRPPVERFSMMDHNAIDEMVTVSYEAARKEIASWLEERENLGD